MSEGYCTVEDVRRVLQKSDLSRSLDSEDNQIVVDAIVGRTGWLQSRTDGHWYVEDGVTEDTHDIIPTGPRSRDPEEHDIPSTPHPQHSTMFSDRRSRYPRRMNGPYTRVRLSKQYVQEVTTLEVRDAGGGYTDWVDDDSKTEGEDYRLYVEPGSIASPSYLDLRAASLPTLQHYGSAVLVEYDYGLDELSDTIRRAVALLSASDLVRDDDMQVSIPDNGQLVQLESKAEAWERKAETLLDEYL